jgi:tetratricopeptide (TPR) repeat protein
MARVAGIAVLLAASIALFPRASAHTRVFLNSQTLTVNSTRNYPDGIQAWLLRMQTSVRSGDAAGVVRALAALDRQGFHSFTILKPTLTPVLSDPRIAEAVAVLARKEIERYQSIDEPLPLELYGQAQAQFQLGELQEAIASLERALQIGSPIDAVIRAALQEFKAELARRQSAKPAATD